MRLPTGQHRLPLSSDSDKHAQGQRAYLLHPADDFRGSHATRMGWTGAPYCNATSRNLKDSFLRTTS